ncbi:basic helix-loop-helix protein 80-like [Bidens hawaiensis]|uniref:basic helix-loop-helix protein 80-like n=1 Tax=Bidens hawaiensis TaxID=980011 RepID=UPI0040494997
METSPFNYHRFLFDQSPSFSDPMITTGFSAQFHQPYEQVVPTSSIEVKSGNYANQASIASQILDSSMSMAVVHDHQSEILKLPCAQTNIKAKTICKRRRRQKKSNDDQENKKKMIDSKAEKQIGYIHVRARRGEATDSHSLAERVFFIPITKLGYPFSLF